MALPRRQSNLNDNGSTSISLFCTDSIDKKSEILHKEVEAGNNSSTIGLPQTSTKDFESTLSILYYTDLEELKKKNELCQVLYKEEYLLLASNYPLNKSKTKWLTIGLSGIRNYKPVVKLSTRKPDKPGMQFSETKWNNLMTFKEYILNYFDSGVACTYKYISGGHALILNNINGKKLLTLSWNSNEFTIVLEMSAVKTMFGINEIILHKLELLQSLQFKEYYIKVVSNVHYYCIINNCSTTEECIETVLNKDINLNECTSI